MSSLAAAILDGAEPKPAPAAEPELSLDDLAGEAAAADVLAALDAKDAKKFRAALRTLINASRE